MSDTVDTARYALIIEWSDDDQAYIATCPELPGCRTHGATRAEALGKGEDLIAEWLEIAAECGWERPVPRPFMYWSNLPGADRIAVPVPIVASAASA